MFPCRSPTSTRGPWAKAITQSATAASKLLLSMVISPGCESELNPLPIGGTAKTITLRRGLCQLSEEVRHLLIAGDAGAGPARDARSCWQWGQTGFNRHWHCGQ